MFSEGPNSVHLSELLANLLIIIIEEHWKTDQISLEYVYGHSESDFVILMIR